MGDPMAHPCRLKPEVARARLARLGAKVVDEVVDYQGIYRLCYIRGPEGILVGLAQELVQQAARVDPMAHKR